MISKILLVLAVTTGLSTGALADDSSIAAEFAGKNLSGHGVDMNINPDGTFTGTVGKNPKEDFAGTWKISNGQWCRTITKPERFKGSQCQDLTVNGDGTVTIDGRRGPAKYTLK
ncbi:MAG: hypothetical protein AAGA50_29660 [Pseudomonadota bacterium]